jgi:hypothetical protein
MAKGQSPLLGFNTNVRHKGRVFHIQTEDSGISHPHIITHLFADGGRILKSIKTPYGELLESPDWVPQVKKIMQDQHKAMFIALRDGQYDALIDGGGSGPKSGQTGQFAAVNPPAAANPVNPAPAGGAGPAVSPNPAAGVRRPSAPGIVVNPTTQPSPVQPAMTNTSQTGAVAGVRPSNPNVPAGPQATGQHSAQPAGSASRTGRYAPVRSPEVLGSFKPKSEPSPASGNIFGDSLMSEKSLDEVILAYLAEDLDDKKR